MNYGFDVADFTAGNQDITGIALPPDEYGVRMVMPFFVDHKFPKCGAEGTYVEEVCPHPMILDLVFKEGEAEAGRPYIGALEKMGLVEDSYYSYAKKTKMVCMTELGNELARAIRASGHPAIRDYREIAGLPNDRDYYTTELEVLGMIKAHENDADDPIFSKGYLSSAIHGKERKVVDVEPCYDCLWDNGMIMLKKAIRVGKKRVWPYGLKALGDDYLDRLAAAESMPYALPEKGAYLTPLADAAMVVVPVKR